MRRLAWTGALLVMMAAAPVGAQQPSVHVAAAAQITTGDQWRLGGQNRLEPDLSIRLFNPGFRFGSLYADLNVTRRNNRPAIGRGVVRLEGWRIAGLTWSLEAGDTWSAPAVKDFGFTNLFSPLVTFEGVSARGSSARTTLLVTAGRVTAQRNLFGTDVRSIGQQLYQASMSHRATDRLDLFARAVHVRSGQMQLYTALTDQSTNLGGGVRYRPGRSVQFVADGGIDAFRRRGASLTEYAPSALVGSLLTFSHGSIQVNAQQYSVGQYAVASYPYGDRSGVFVAGDVDLWSWGRLFGGGEYAKSNLNTAASSRATVSVPPGSYSRAYGGIRFGIGTASMFTIRVEGGGREIRPSKFSTGFESDTGVVTTEWNAHFHAASLFARYERRSNVDRNDSGSSFTQHDASGQLYINLRGGRQVYVLGRLSRRADRSGDGETAWQFGGGAQLPLGPLSFRLEGTTGRTREWTQQTISNRQTLAIGLGGRIAVETYLSVDCYVDHAPFAAGASGSPWVTRTMLRLTRSFPLGRASSPRLADRPFGGGPSGRIDGVVFADWNGNGVMDADEPPVNGITVSLGALGAVETGRDGRFTFAGVPVGDRSVSLDLASVPADYDTPAEASQTVVVARSRTATVQVPLLPLGTIVGVVYQDVDGDGKLSDADQPIERAVLVLDDGARTEQTRAGRFRFDSVRMGSHAINLLIASLPDSAQLTGPATTTVELRKEHALDEVTFLVKLEKRPEVRKVFPPKK